MVTKLAGNRKASKPTDGGFTLIELMMVIVVISVLATIVIAAVSNATRSANINACKADIQLVQSALIGYKNDFNGYKSGMTLTDLESGKYLTLQSFNDADQKYKIDTAITVTGSGSTATASIKVTGSASATFAVDDPAASAETTCRTAMGG